MDEEILSSASYWG